MLQEGQVPSEVYYPVKTVVPRPGDCSDNKAITAFIVLLYYVATVLTVHYG